MGGLAGLGSVLLWGGAFAFGWFHLELLWIGLSAVWWLALAQLMRERERRIAILTAVTGVAAALDAAVTGIETGPAASHRCFCAAHSCLRWLRFTAAGRLRAAAYDVCGGGNCGSAVI
ncbi:MAG: hypothetical protein NVS1B3_03320 [Candidatus Dormibacteraceae bacterium]